MRDGAARHHGGVGLRHRRRRRPCRELSVEQLQVVEIARALARGARCVLLDEPTAALEREAIRRLFERVRQLTAAGVAVLYISHHLEEVFEICQDVAVLRDGELVLAAPTASLSKDDLVAAMVGGVATAAPPGTAPDGGHRGAPRRRGEAAPGDVVLAVDGLSSRLRPRPARAACRCASHAGEVRRRHRAAQRGRGHARAGWSPARRPAPAARSCCAGGAVPPGSRAAAQRAGIGYIPEDRRAEGFVAHLGVAENITMTITRQLAGRLGVLAPRPPGRRRGAVHLPALAGVVRPRPAGRRAVRRQPAEGHRRPDARARPVAHRRDHADPGRGRRLEGAAARLARRRRPRARGAGVLLCSDELSDLEICDRVVVLVRGEVFTEFSRAALRP